MNKILIVDDHDLTREKLISILLVDNYIITTAKSAKDALKLLKQKSLDLIITDIIMPEMEGLEFIREIRKAYPKLKIIAVSAYKPFYLQVAMEMGANAICEKKNVNQNLLNLVRQVLDN